MFLTLFTLILKLNLILSLEQSNTELLEKGRIQYQLIKERENLPKYGSCWRSALEHLESGCKKLNENTQSDMALHITNCFLEMSGHETYNCELDKKQNLRSICINSMSDRAFNVYTEFYTHTQSICWFLKGQVWHEMISESTWQVGRQLEESAQTQARLLKAQKDSLEMQEKMIKHGLFLEHVLEDLYVSTKAHQDILKVLSSGLVNLQSWIVGEISWIDSILFYITIILAILLVTSSKRTIGSRIILFTVLFINLMVERSICSLFVRINDTLDTSKLYSNIYAYVWYCRYFFTFIGVIILIYNAFIYKNIVEQNNLLLNSIYMQNNSILEVLKNTPNNTSKKSLVKVVNEHSDSDKSPKSVQNDTYDENHIFDIRTSTPIRHSLDKIQFFDNIMLSSSKSFSKSKRRYNLRTRTATPDSGINNV